MLILIEGMDGTGKTTLANKLLKMFPQFEYKKPVPSKGPEGQNADHMINWMLKTFKEAKENNYLLDRVNLVSEEIYGPICRGFSILRDNEKMITVMSQFFALNPIIIYCRPQLGTIMDNLTKEPDIQMSGVLERAEPLVLAYDRFFDNWKKVGVEVIDYNYTITSEDKIKKLVSEAITKRC